MLAVLMRVVTMDFSSSALRADCVLVVGVEVELELEDPEARAMLARRCFSFFATRSLRSLRASSWGLWSTSRRDERVSIGGWFIRLDGRRKTKRNSRNIRI